MKVLHLVPHIPPPDFVVNDLEHSKKLADIETMVMKSNRSGGWKRLPIVLVKMFLKAIRIIKKRPHVIHCHFMTTAIPAALSGIPAVLTMHESWVWYPFWWKPFIKIAARRCKIIFISQHNRNMWLPVLGKDGKVIYHAIDSELFNPDKFDAVYRSSILEELGVEHIVMLMGPFSPKRAYHLAIRACRNLRNKGMKIGIVFRGYGGTSWYKEYLFNLIDKLDIPAKIFTERLEDEALARLYSSSDVFIRPGIAEGFGIAVLEAQGCGTPVIVSNCASLKELFSDSALTFEPMDVEDLTKQIEVSLTDEGVREELIRKGIENAQSYSWSKKIRKYVERYKDAING